MLGLDDGVTATEDEILTATNALLGKTFGEIDEELKGMANDERARSKHGVANVIEEGYFNIPINASPKPDFEHAGVELKVTPLRLTGNNDLVRPKERLVLSMVDYNDLAAADHWTEVPTLQKKLHKTLIIWYIHVVGEDRADYPIVWWHLWEPMESERWSQQLQADFEILKEKVLDGETPSEKHTKLLGTCPKHSGGYNHDNPAQSPSHARVASDAHPVLDNAERRGWSIGISGMMTLFRELLDLPMAKRGRASGIEIAALEERASERAGHEMKPFLRDVDIEQG
jgi:DNA mismatch repair protein MutH